MVMNKLIDTGHISKLIAKYDSNTICNPVKEDQGTPLSYQKLFLLFALIIIGMASALIVMICEVLKNQCKPKIEAMKQPKSKEISTQTPPTEDINLTTKITISPK